MAAPSILESHPYADFLDHVEKPARYAGGEVGAVVKDWGARRGHASASRSPTSTTSG